MRPPPDHSLKVPPPLGPPSSAKTASLWTMAGLPPSVGSICTSTPARKVGSVLGAAKYLEAFFCEIRKESREREAGPVDGGFTNPPVKTRCGTEQLQLERLGMPGIKVPHGDHRKLGLGSVHANTGSINPKS